MVGDGEYVFNNEKKKKKFTTTNRYVRKYNFEKKVESILIQIFVFKYDQMYTVENIVFIETSTVRRFKTYNNDVKKTPLVM